MKNLNTVYDYERAAWKNGLITQNSYQQWFVDQPWNYFVSFNPNSPSFNYRITADFVAKQKQFLKHFHARLDRKLLGRNWSKFPANDRTTFVAFPEIGSKGNLLGWHALMHVPQGHNDTNFRRIAKAQFEEAWLDFFFSHHENSIIIKKRKRMKKLSKNLFNTLTSDDREWLVRNHKWLTKCKGQIDIRPFKRNSTFYSTKKLWSKFAIENFIFSSEFQGSS